MTIFIFHIFIFDIYDISYIYLYDYIYYCCIYICYVSACQCLVLNGLSCCLLNSQDNSGNYTSVEFDFGTVRYRTNRPPMEPRRSRVVPPRPPPQPAVQSAPEPAAPVPEVKKVSNVTIWTKDRLCAQSYLFKLAKFII